MKKHKKVEEEKKKRRRREEKRREKKKRKDFRSLKYRIRFAAADDEMKNLRLKPNYQTRVGQVRPLPSALPPREPLSFPPPFFFLLFFPWKAGVVFVAGKLFHHVAFEIEKLKDSFLSFSFFFFLGLCRSCSTCSWCIEKNGVPLCRY